MARVITQREKACFTGSFHSNMLMQSKHDCDGSVAARLWKADRKDFVCLDAGFRNAGKSSLRGISVAHLPCGNFHESCVPRNEEFFVMGNWKEWSFGIYSKQLPRVPACYVAYLDGKLVYVGQTCDLYKRFYQHNIRFGYSDYVITPWGNCKKVTIKYRLSRKYGDWAMTELRLIKRLQPVQNCAGSIKKRRTPNE